MFAEGYFLGAAMYVALVALGWFLMLPGEEGIPTVRILIELSLYSVASGLGGGPCTSEFAVETRRYVS